MSRRINEHRPPTTHEWNEFERQQPDDFVRRLTAPKSAGPRRGPTPLPLLTDAQIAHEAKWIYTRLNVLIDALDAEKWDGRWTNKLMQAWLSARRTIKDASTLKEDTDAVARHMDPDEEETKPAAGGNPADGSGSQAGEA